MVRPSKRRHYRIAQKQLKLRNKLWLNLEEDRLWIRTENVGFTTIPRTIPLILNIMDALSKGKPVSSAYLELWCRTFDECFVTVNKAEEMAFHSGFTGQRAVTTWKDRVRILAELKFIDIKSGPSGAISYVLIWNPYKVIKMHHEQGHLGLGQDAYNALMARAIEIGADDLD